MGANLVGGNRTAHLCGRVDPLMIVRQVLMGVGNVSASLCEANDKRPFPPGGRVNTHIATPSDAEKLTNLTDYTGHKIPISKLIVAYSRPPNLGNLLSCRKVKPQGNYSEIQHDNALHLRER